MKINNINIFKYSIITCLIIFENLLINIAKGNLKS